METPAELVNYFMQIPSELKDEITREFDKDVNIYLLPKLKEITRECGLNTLKRLAAGLRKNTIDPGKNTHLTHSDTHTSAQLPHAGQHLEKIRLVKAGNFFKVVRPAEDQKDVPAPSPKKRQYCGKCAASANV